MPFDKEVTMSVGVIAERRQIDHPWADHSWRPVALLPGFALADNEAELPRELERGESWQRFLVGCLPVVLHRKETEAYVQNLTSARPAIYVILQQDGEAILPVLATASPFDAQDYLDSGEDIIEALPIPEEMLAWLEDFVSEHHVEETFKKRKRQPFKEEAPIFGKTLHPIEARFYKRKGAKKPN